MRTYIAVLLAFSFNIAAAAPSQFEISGNRKDCIYAPIPEYPLALRKSGIGGEGNYVMNIDTATGHVRSVDVLKSTGVPLLDESVVRTLRQWRFKPGTEAHVKCPMKFSTPVKRANEKR